MAKKSIRFPVEVPPNSPPPPLAFPSSSWSSRILMDGSTRRQQPQQQQQQEQPRSVVASTTPGSTSTPSSGTIQLTNQHPSNLPSSHPIPKRHEVMVNSTTSSHTEQPFQLQQNQQQQQQQQRQFRLLKETSSGPPKSIIVDERSQELWDDDVYPLHGDGTEELGLSNHHNFNSTNTITTNNNNNNETHTSLLELGEETMAQAMLIFLLADLRRLSATGRIRTLYEHLALDSDRSPRLTSRDFAGFYDYDETDGVTASHIMGVLLVEILREAEDVSFHHHTTTTNKGLNSKARRRRPPPTLLSPWSSPAESTGVNARTIFKRDIQAANGMPSLLHCYNTMLSEDVNPKITPVSRQLYPLDQDIAFSHAPVGGVGGNMDDRDGATTVGNEEHGDVLTDFHESEDWGGTRWTRNTGSRGDADQQWFEADNQISNNDNNTDEDVFSENPEDPSLPLESYVPSETIPGTDPTTFLSAPLAPPSPPFTKIGRSTSLGHGHPLSYHQQQQQQQHHSHIRQQHGIATPLSRRRSGGGSVGPLELHGGTPVTADRERLRSGASVGQLGLHYGTPIDPIIPTTSTMTAIRSVNRRASTTNMQVSHFNPSVDEAELANDDDSVTQFEVAIHRRKTIVGNPMNSRKHASPEPGPHATATTLAIHTLPSSSNLTHPPQPTTLAVAGDKTAVNTTNPAPTLKFTELLRERMEKALPEHLAHKVNELTQRVNELTKTREQKELDEIAHVQKELLKWGLPGEDGGSGDQDDQLSVRGNSTRKRVNNSNNSTYNNDMESSAPATTVLGSARNLFGGVRNKVKEEFHDEPSSKSASAPPPPPLTDEKGEDEKIVKPEGGGGKGGSRDGGRGAIPPEKPSEDAALDEVPEYHDSDTIRQLILQALDKRDFWRLNFIKTFFREGTVSHVLANSRAEMVWLSDWHTQSECTYAISIDREKKKVLLAFRGAYTESDWRHIVDWYDTATSNPVKDDYPGRPTNIRMHSGFHKSLFRVRKDTGTTKYDEIAAKLSHYCHITGPNTRITITGHSLGAALACIFSLYASTEDRFTAEYGAIECVTFGTPCIANWRFAGAVKHQENAGKLRMAKFRVKGDSVPHLPPALIRWSSRGAQYWHSGIDVSLPYIRKGRILRAVLGGQPKPKVTYWDPDEESYFGSLVRQVREYYVWNLPLRFWRFALFHTLVEHKKRMSLVSKSDPNSLLAKYSLKELYEMRGDLTRRRFWRRKRSSKVGGAK